MAGLDSALARVRSLENGRRAHAPAVAVSYARCARTWHTAAAGGCAAPDVFDFDLISPRGACSSASYVYARIRPQWKGFWNHSQQQCQPHPLCWLGLGSRSMELRPCRDAHSAHSAYRCVVEICAAAHPFKSFFWGGIFWISGGRCGPALCFIKITSIPGKAWTHANSKFLLEFCLCLHSSDDVTVTLTSFKTCRSHVVMTQIDNDHANSTPPTKFMTTMSGPISFITGLCTCTALQLDPAACRR